MRGKNEAVITKPPFEKPLNLWGYFNVPITIEWVGETLNPPVTVQHEMEFKQIKQKNITVKFRQPGPGLT